MGTNFTEVNIMLTNFKELEDYVLSRNMKKRIALANAHD